MPLKFSSQANAQTPSNGAINKTEFLQYRQQFHSQFKVNGTSPITQSFQTISYADMNALGDGTSDESLVLIHYGLDSKKNIVYGFSFVTGTLQPNGSISYTGGDQPSHLLKAGGLVPTNATIWTPYANAYHTTVEVMRIVGGSFQNLNNLDAKRTVLPWKTEVQLMYQQNVGASTDCRLVMDSVSLKHSNADGGNSGFRAGVAFYTERLVNGNYLPMMDDIHYVTIYKHKAADHGVLCPPTCSSFSR